MGLDFKDDKQIARLVEKVENGDRKKTDAANFSRLLREMVEEVLDEQKVKFRFEEEGFVAKKVKGGSGSVEVDLKDQDQDNEPYRPISSVLEEGEVDLSSQDQDDEPYKHVDSVLEEDMSVSGQASERNLVSGIKQAVAQNGGPFKAHIGGFGQVEIVDARQMGGGRPEPKADIVVVSATGEEIGISMKKENFAFMENWMDEAKLRQRLTQVGLEDNEAGLIVKELKDTLAELTLKMASVITSEKEAFMRIATEASPSYSFPDPIDENILSQLVQSSEFGRAGKFKNSFKITNFYAKLSDILQEKYKALLKIIVGGGADNPAQAQAVLIADVPSGLTEPEDIKNILSKALPVDAIVEKYSKDPNVNIRFRLRPITKVRTTYSRTNRGKYRKGQKLYENAELGISWTAFVSK